MRIPSNAAPEVQAALREVWAAIDRLAGARNVDMSGRRIINAGAAVDTADYATLGDVEDRVAAVPDSASPVGTDPTFKTVTVPTIYGSKLDNGDLTLEGTKSATKTTSYIILQPTGGLVGVAMTPTKTLDVTGTFGVSGVATLAGNLSVGAGNFYVYAASGNTVIVGTLECDGGFGCNSANAQTGYASGGTVAYTSGTDHVNDARLQLLYTLVGKIQTALVSNGILSN
jgi:hypothetical protein